ncbi:MAG: SDR family NAD(P)-dependent oxidoreductase [Ilyomonas sp.]
MNNTTKYALITGATSGIGYELAKLFAKDGYNLVIVARNRDELIKTASELKQQHNIKVETLSKDLFDRKAAFEVYDEVINKGIHIDVLVNDAGQGEYGLFVETDINRQLDIVQLNIASVLILTHSFLKDMIAKGEGKILNLASIASEMPGPWQAVYHGTKAFVLSFSEALRIEVKDKGVTVTALLPGATDTDFFNKADMEQSKIVQEGKLSDPEQVAKDGYEALMSGDDKIVSGFKNKMMVAMSNIMPDETSAKQMAKQQQPVEKNK